MSGFRIFSQEACQQQQIRIEVLKPRTTRTLLFILFMILTLADAFSKPAEDYLSERSYDRIDTVWSERYREARNIRTLQGPSAAVPYYRTLLQDNPQDITAASRIAAASPKRHDRACLYPSYITNDNYDPNDDDDSFAREMPEKETFDQLRDLLRECGYHNQIILSSFFGDYPRIRDSLSPILLRPATSGSASKLPFDTDQLLSSQDGSSNTPPFLPKLSCMVSMFLLGLCVSRTTLLKCFEPSQIALLENLGFLFPCTIDPEYLVPYVQIFPIDTFDGPSSTTSDGKRSRQTVWTVTDWHPRVLATTTIGAGTQSSEPVMYIGPDTLSLVRYMLTPLSASELNDSDLFQLPRVDRMLDLCTGSGVQALVALKNGFVDEAVCVDINERAVRFTLFNAALNQMEDRVQCICADLFTGLGREVVASSFDSFVENEPMALDEILKKKGGFGLITANPPFLPVPPGIDKARHSLFSSGGSSGETVLAAIVQLAPQYLLPGGYLTLVSEFFLSTATDPMGPLIKRMSLWWGDTYEGKGVLFTNEQPVSAETYAKRRAGENNLNDCDIWIEHLQSLEISACSPGLLVIRKEDPMAPTIAASETATQAEPGNTDLFVVHELVPSSGFGSLWTPSNLIALTFVQKTLHKHYIHE